MLCDFQEDKVQTIWGFIYPKEEYKETVEMSLMLVNWECFKMVWNVNPITSLFFLTGVSQSDILAHIILSAYCLKLCHLLTNMAEKNIVSKSNNR